MIQGRLCVESVCQLGGAITYLGSLGFIPGTNSYTQYVREDGHRTGKGRDGLGLP